MSKELHRVIDRFVNGEMRPAEERDFMTLMELDPELDRLFKAERVVQSTMTNDREALARIDHSEGYARFLNGLASSVRGKVPQGGMLPAGSGAGFGNRAATATALALIVGICALVAADLGGWWNETSPTTSIPAPVRSHTPLPSVAPVPDGKSEEGRAATVRDRFSRRDGERVSDGDNEKKGREITAPVNEVQRRDLNIAAPVGTVAPATIDSSVLHREVETEELPLFQDDTMRTRIHVRPDDR